MSNGGYRLFKGTKPSGKKRCETCGQYYEDLDEDGNCKLCAMYLVRLRREALERKAWGQINK